MRYNYNGLSKNHPRLYKCWWTMLGRCENPKNRKFFRYGARGIQVCAEWHSFPAFCAWAVENGYSSTATIDREDNDGNYEPDNCRWATPKQQARNRSDNVLYEYNDEWRCLPEWAELYGLKTITLVCRVKRMGWTLERALKEPVREKDGMVTVGSRTQRLSAWATETGLNKDLIYLRLRRGWSPERALSPPTFRGHPKHCPEIIML